MNTAQIRQTFLDYFKKHGHSVVASSPLIPANDPSLLFTNAGMVQFKDVFLGDEQRDYNRATSSQRCVRAGGKHNDLENVGYTARHHTFFEMLGNFSFGDYFKREAIEFAWHFLTKELGLPEEKLWVTVYTDDDEAADIWLKDLGVSADRFSRCGDDENFWSMGDTGPCGPCSEIFYDHGEAVAGGPPGSPDAEGDRYIEIWNLVFMQYNRDSDGQLTPLPKPSVDTGMGLERIAAVLQNVHNNYDIDLFQGIITEIAKLAKVDDLSNTSLRVIADHIRSCAFLIVDGVRPSNEGRGYVLRRIIRRAVRHGNSLGLREPFFYQICSPLVQQMGHAYPELAKAQSTIERVLKLEEEQFARTLEQGLDVLEKALKTIAGSEIPGEVIFRLYDTYGFPIDLTGDIARERGLTLDVPGFEARMAKQRSQAQAASQFSAKERLLSTDKTTQFTGYHTLTDSAAISALYVDGQAVSKLPAGQTGVVVLAQTPFYAESGGQVGDTGELRTADALFKVIDTRRSGEAILHHGELIAGELKVNEQVDAIVDLDKRQATALNHSATHLLHSALRQVLGEHVVQKGSLVTPERLRFDFTHFEPLTQNELVNVEALVNEKIRENSHCVVKEMKTDEALKSGALALFGEKYADSVRVLNMGEGFSVELCGGTHVEYSGEIGVFKIIAESGIAAGVRRIEALTGQGALQYINQSEQNLQSIAALLKANREDALVKIEQLLDKSKTLEKENKHLLQTLSRAKMVDLLDEAVDVAGHKVLVTQLEHADGKALREQIDDLKARDAGIIVCLASRKGDKIALAAGVGDKAVDKLSAVDLVNHVALQVGGKGGGRRDFAQAGGDQPGQLSAALQGVVAWLRAQLA